jgi:putative flippase GtrA
MQELLKKHETKLRFGIIGGINTALDFGLLFVFSSLFGIPRGFANMLSTSISFIFSFFANKRYTFKSSSKENVVREMVLFTVVTLFGLWVIQGLIIHFLTPVIINLGTTEELALLASKLIATVASLIWNYLLYSRVVFKHKN